MTSPQLIDEVRLRRFARIAAPVLQGAAARGIGPQAARRRAGQGLEFLDLRPFVVGDDVRHVDWRQSARRRKPVVRRYRDETASDWILCLDGSASMSGGWPLARELAIALSYAVLHAGHTVSLLVFAERLLIDVPAGRGSRQFVALLRELEQFAPMPSGGASLPGICGARLHGRANVVVISDFLRRDGMADDLRLLQARAASVSGIRVSSVSDTEPGAAGSVRIVDIESGTGRPVDLDEAARSAAASALSKHRRQTRYRMAALGIPLTESLAGEPWERVLLSHLGA